MFDDWDLKRYQKYALKQIEFSEIEEEDRVCVDYGTFVYFFRVKEILNAYKFLIEVVFEKEGGIIKSDTTDFFDVEFTDPDNTTFFLLDIPPDECGCGGTMRWQAMAMKCDKCWKVSVGG